MGSTSDIVPIFPGHSLGPFHLGASLYEVCSIIKADKDKYPAIDVHFSINRALTAPVTVSLPQNGMRVRFDGADQRLRLIEVLDFKRIRLSFKGSELVKPQDASQSAASPSFKRIYQIFGASYPGEFIPTPMTRNGTYTLSWNGIAFNFPLLHSAWSQSKDHVSLLGSNAAGPASSMALFEGSSWPEARRDLFTREIPTAPRSSAYSSRPKDNLPIDVEVANVQDGGRVELARRAPASPFTIIINQTIPQDLITELGPPDTTHKREHKIASPEQQPKQRRTSSHSRSLNNGRPHVGSAPSSYSSTGTDTFETDFDSGDAEEDPAERANREVFWCYFSHGMDILIGPPRDSPDPKLEGIEATPLSASPHLVVLKVIIHGNVPGSYAFNRHRRLRWNLTLPSTAFVNDLNSEANFDLLKQALLRAFAGVWPESEMSRGKVVNRTWGGSPSDSSFFLPDAGEDLVEGGGSEQWLGNTRLYTFPNLVFEVLETGAVSALTVY